MKFHTTYLFLATILLLLVAVGSPAMLAQVPRPTDSGKDTTARKPSFPKTIPATVAPINPTMRVAPRTAWTDLTDTPSVAERRLHELDSIMVTAPVDSLPRLRAEYLHLRDSLSGSTPPVNSGVPLKFNPPITTQGEPAMKSQDGVQPEPIDKQTVVTQNESAIKPEDTTDKADAVDDVSGLKGFRKRELNTGSGTITSAGSGEVGDTVSTEDPKRPSVRHMKLSAKKPKGYVDPSVPKTKKSTKPDATDEDEPMVRDLASEDLDSASTPAGIDRVPGESSVGESAESGRSRTARATPRRNRPPTGFHYSSSEPVRSYASTERPTAEPTVVANTQSARDRQAVEGIASARARKYKAATAQLAAAVKGKTKKVTPQRNAVTYYYAQSLERSGRLGEAASAYLALARKSHGAYLSYCRVLSNMGQRGRARTLVLAFIKQHPSSSETVSARRLLQSL